MNSADPARTRKDPVDNVLGRDILLPATVVVLGAIMTILDATFVNVALPTLGRQFRTSISTIQWVATAYLLAFAAVIPLTGWLAARFGAKKVWVVALITFLAGSLLAGLSWSIGTLIVCRVVQGLGGGIIMPLGQAMLARIAGPRRMGRVMSIIGIPMLLAPVFGPLVGGALIGFADWRWIFFVNLPVGLVAIASALALLPTVAVQPARRLDVLGAVLLSGGLVSFLYGLAETGQRSSLTRPIVSAPMAAGLVLVALFARHSSRSHSPLIDIRLFRIRSFTTANLLTFVLGTSLFGVALLVPLYLEILRGRDAEQTGLLLAPQGIGAALTIGLAGYLTDKIGARPVVIVGALPAIAGTAWCARFGPHTPYWALVSALLLVGAGLGATITPAMAAAYHDLPPASMTEATAAINVVQRVAGAFGSALLAVVLQHSMTSRLPGFHGEIGQATALAATSGHTATAIGHAFDLAFAAAACIAVLALIPAAAIPAAQPPDSH